MKINYYLKRNALSTSDENRFMAGIKKKETLYQDDLINVMLGKNTTVTRQDIIVVLDLLKESVSEQILSGNPINTDLFKADLSIRGGFTSSADEFDSARHQVCVNLNASADLKKRLAFYAEVERVLPNITAPVIRQIFDYTSGDFAVDFTAGSLIELKGAYLKAEELTSFVYLRLDDSEEMIEVSQIHKTTERTILCNLPEGLAAGNYWITVTLGEGDEAVRGTYDNMISIL